MQQIHHRHRQGRFGFRHSNAAARSAGLLRARAWRGRRHDARLHVSCRRRPWLKRSIATLRYQFPYMEAGGKRPDTPAKAHAAVRAAGRGSQAKHFRLAAADGGRQIVRRAHDLAGAGGRTAAGVVGLAFFGFPLHPAGKPSADRAKHLADIDIPMLFLQGSRDSLAELKLLEPVVDKLGASRCSAPGRRRRSFLPCAGAFGTQ